MMKGIWYEHGGDENEEMGGKNSNGILPLPKNRIDKSSNGISPLRQNRISESSDGISPYVPSHEACHIWGLRHMDGVKWNLMYDGILPNSKAPTGAKRLTPNQVNEIRKKIQ